MTYTEKELDQFLHGISLSLLSKKSAQHWRYDEETAKEIEWLEALERKVRADKADRKTEPTISKMEQVEDEPQTELVNDSPILVKDLVKDLVDDEFNPYDEECMRCKHLKLQCEFVPSYCKYEPRDEPQKHCHRPSDVACHPEQGDLWCRGCDYWYANEPQTEREGE